MELSIIVFLLVGIWYFAQLAIWNCASIGFLWIIPKEGEATAIMRNKKFHKMVLRYTGYRFSGKKGSGASDYLEAYDIVKDEDPGLISTLTSLVFPIRGVSWIGIPPFFSIHKYKFEWTDASFEKREPEELEWILVQKYVYGLILDKIELQGGIPYTIKLLITLQITNPAKALFRVKHWLDTTMERISGWARDEFSSLSIDDFVAPVGDREMGDYEGHTGPRLERALQRIMDSASNQLTQEFGVSISIVQVAEIDPADESLRSIIIQREVAKQKALAEIEAAHGQAEAAIEEARGQAEAINIVNAAAEKMCGNAMLLKSFHALEHAGANVSLIGRDLNLPAMLQIPTSKQEGGSK